MMKLQARILSVEVIAVRIKCLLEKSLVARAAGVSASWQSDECTAVVAGRAIDGPAKSAARLPQRHPLNPT
jgi:hypothetical protein